MAISSVLCRCSFKEIKFEFMSHFRRVVGTWEEKSLPRRHPVQSRHVSWFWSVYEKLLFDELHLRNCWHHTHGKPFHRNERCATLRVNLRYRWELSAHFVFVSSRNHDSTMEEILTPSMSFKEVSKLIRVAYVSVDEKKCKRGNI